MSEYKYDEYDNYENDKLVYSNNDTKYKTYNNFDSYLLFYFVCILFGSYFCYPYIFIQKINTKYITMFIKKIKI